MLSLRTFVQPPLPPPVSDHQVPTLLPPASRRRAPHRHSAAAAAVRAGLTSGWDLALQRVLPYIDGRCHVARIAERARMDVTLVRRSLRQLLYWGAVAMVDIFQVRSDGGQL